MPEQQNIEYKSSWHDDYLKWIGGFANAQGRRIYIGKQNDGRINEIKCVTADVCFKGGLIDAWGRGTLRIIDACKEAGLPEPELIEQDGGFLVTLFKNNLSEELLKKLGLNERQIKAVICNE